MLTTKYVRDNADAIRKSLVKRKSAYPLDRLLELDREWRLAKMELQVLQERRNKASLAISEAKKKGSDISGMVSALGEVKKGLDGMEKKLPEMQLEIDKILWNMPNVLHDAVPYGESSEQNVTIKKWGTITKKSSKGHEEILTKLGMLDIERAAKVAGARFYYLKGDMVLLEQSLMRFALDSLSKKGYTIVSPPYMVKKKYYKGVTALGDFEDALYRIGDPKEVEAQKDYEKVEDELQPQGHARRARAVGIQRSAALNLPG